MSIISNTEIIWFSTATGLPSLGDAQLAYFDRHRRYTETWMPVFAYWEWRGWSFEPDHVRAYWTIQSGMAHQANTFAPVTMALPILAVQ